MDYNISITRPSPYSAYNDTNSKDSVYFFIFYFSLLSCLGSFIIARKCIKRRQQNNRKRFSIYIPVKNYNTCGIYDYHKINV